MPNPNVSKVVRGPNGELVLIDPMAVEVVKAVAQHNCRSCSLDANQERVEHFRNRAVVLGKTPKEFVIVIANVDDANGAILAEALMPGYNWQEIRDKGQTPFARGLADRQYVMQFLKIMDPEFTPKENPVDVEVVVVDYNWYLVA